MELLSEEVEDVANNFGDAALYLVEDKGDRKHDQW
jgi:hypothetical protein